MKFTYRALIFFVIGFTANAVDLPTRSPVFISPSDKCRLGFISSKGLSVTAIDKDRLEVSWAVDKREIRTQIRATCESEEFKKILAEEGFSQAGQKWKFTSGAKGGSSARSISTRSWNGVVGTYFLGNICHITVGQSYNGGTVFTLSACVAESDYPYAKKIFDSLEMDVVLDAPLK